MTALRRSAATFSHGTLFKIGFICLAYLDLVLTLFAVQNGFGELNPLMLRMLGRPVELALVKVAAPLLIAWLVPDKLLVPSIALLLVVSGWNVTQLFTLL